MLMNRQSREDLEASTLAAYACRSAESRGRPVPEAGHAHRTAFQRDRDRIIHSPCFRRLEYKTQVFINGTADHYRTRLTHTIEVAAVARTLARALNANEDLAEAIALAHDIGHCPFGHVGEKALDDLMENEGGFDHNIQSLRWVELLESRYPDYQGLNLTWEVRSGLRKHLSKEPGRMLDGHPIGPWQGIEAQIADVADDMTYYAHDVDDGLDAGLITEEQLGDLDMWQEAGERARAEFPGIGSPHLLPMTIRCLLDLQVEDVLTRSEDLLKRYQPASPAEVMNCEERIVGYSESLWKKLGELRRFLFQNVYWHPKVHRANEEAVQMMSRLFLFYVEHPEAMGRKARARLEKQGSWRTACDYVSGMTDRYALEEYMKHIEHKPRTSGSTDAQGG